MSISVTINDVAEKAGVAISTVSNIINNKSNVSPKTRDKVLKVIDDLGYEVDPVASRMKKGNSKIIGMIITNFNRIFYPPAIRCCREIAASMGYVLLCAETNEDFEVEQQYVLQMQRNGFDGLILNTVATNDNQEYFHMLQYLHCRDKHIPVVCIERNLAPQGLDSVDTDNYGGAVKATNHLIDLGCKAILHIAGSANSWAAQKRMEGFCDAIKRHPEVTKIIHTGDFSPRSGYNVVRNSVINPDRLPFDGIFAANDQVAIGAMKALQERGVKIPEQVRVVGFDDSFAASLIEPSLSSIHVSSSGLGTEAIRVLIERMEGSTLPAQCRHIKTGLVIRHSTDRDIYVSKEYLDWW